MNMNTKPQNCSVRTTYSLRPMRCHRLFFICSLVAMCLAAGHWSSLLAAPKTEVIVKSGDPAPDGDGTFDLGLAGDLTAVLNNCGWAAFRGNLIGTTHTYGLFLADGTTRTQVARSGDAAPGGAAGAGDMFGGSGPNFSIPALNDASQLLFLGRVINSSSPNAPNVCLFRGKPFSRLLDWGQSLPGGNGMVFPGTGNPDAEWPAFNDKGLAAFVARLTSTQGYPNDDSAIYRTSAPGKLTQIAREGQPLPGGNGTFGEMIYGYPYGGIVPPAMNEAGQVAFVDRSGIDVVGIYRGDGKTPIKKI